MELLAEQETYNGWNIPDDDGETPLMLAIRRDRTDILKVLLDCPRVDPNLKDKEGTSPFMKAIKEEKTAMAMMMIQCPRLDLKMKDLQELQMIARWVETESDFRKLFFDLSRELPCSVCFILFRICSKSLMFILQRIIYEYLRMLHNHRTILGK